MTLAFVGRWHGGGVGAKRRIAAASRRPNPAGKVVVSRRPAAQALLVSVYEMTTSGSRVSPLPPVSERGRRWRGATVGRHRD